MKTWSPDRMADRLTRCILHLALRAHFVRPKRLLPLCRGDACRRCAPRIELPTARFVEVAVASDTNRNSKLDGPPSPLKPLRSVESRQSSVNRYVFATLTVYCRMSALPESGRSDQWKITKTKGRFRPEADVANSA